MPYMKLNNGFVRVLVSQSALQEGTYLGLQLCPV